MTVLVTGGAGYIGSVCAEVLIAKGFQVIAVDNLTEGNRAAVPPEGVFIRADIGDRAQLDELFTRFEIDAVMHFAGEALVEKSIREPSAFYAINVGCGVLLIDAMVRHRVKKLVFSSSCAVYGEPKYSPITEEHPLEPVNAYGKSKIIFERILLDYQSYEKLDSVSLRYFNVAGASALRGEARRTETHLIPRVLDVALGLRSTVAVCGADYETPDGTCVRDYVHVLDIAEAHVAALNCFDRVTGRSFNIGAGIGYSILEIVDACRKATGHPIPVEFVPRRPGDPSALVASGKALESAIRWKPTHSTIEEIVESAWFWRQRFPNGYR